MKIFRLIRGLTFVLACPALLSQLHADEMNDLMTTVMQASPEVKAKAQAYQHSSKKVSSSAKSTNSDRSSTGVPDMQIPDSEVLEVASKFPRNYIGKYVYGPVTFGDLSDFGSESGYLIGFWAKNKRCFYLETMDPQVAAKFKTYTYGTKFEIPRTCPLRIVKKCAFNYIVRLPFEAANPNQ